MHIALLLPQLLWPEPDDKMALEKLSCPDLEWLLAHGIPSRRPARAYEDALAALFGRHGDAPFGALRLLGESVQARAAEARAGFWLCADPVHLRFHHERILLADAGAFELCADEAHALVAGLNREFADMGQFHAAETRRWYVRLKEASDFAALPLSAVAGRRVEGELPSQSGGGEMRAWLNEIQMFLHGHEVNAARAGAGHPAVNSLWLWGAGPLAAAADPGYDGAWSGAPLALGLARAAGIPTHPQPERLDSLLAHADARSNQLVVLDDLLPPVLYEDPNAWREALQRLEADWFAPLRAALGRQVEAATLLAPTVYGELAWEVKAAERWKFWRRPQPLADLARELAR